MKKLFTIVLLMVFTIASYAQSEVGKTKVTPMVGATSATMTGFDFDRKLGFIVGAEAQNQLNSFLALSGGLFFAQEGYKSDEVGEDYSLRANYLNVPVLLNAYVVKGLALKAGLQPEFLLSAKARGIDYKDDMNSIGISLPVGASYEFSNLVLDFRYNIGLTNSIKLLDRGINVKGKNSVLQLTLGYRF